MTNERIRRDFQFQFTPFEETLQDTVQSLADLGLVKKKTNLLTPVILTATGCVIGLSLFYILEKGVIESVRQIFE